MNFPPLPPRLHPLKLISFSSSYILIFIYGDRLRALRMGARVRLGASLPFLLPVLSAHLLWAVYESLSLSLPPSLSQEECQSVRCQSQLRLPFHLSFLPMTEEGAGGGGGGRTATLPTHTLDTLHFWKQCWSGGKPKCDAFSPVSIRSSDCFMTFAFLLLTPACSEDGFWRIVAAQLAVCPNCLSFQVAHPSAFWLVCLFWGFF